jgi:hypothetical protein
VWAYSSTPVEVSRLDVQLGHLDVGHRDAFVVGVAVKPTLYGKAFAGLARRDQLDNDLMGQQRLATSILRYEGKQAMLDAVPLAGTGRKMPE